MNNEDQIEAWNGETGEKWAEHADRLDQLLAPFLPAILDEAKLKHGEHVLDIGCGAGALSLEAAQTIGVDQGVCGVDVSSQPLEVARKRARQKNLDINFVEQDASHFRVAKPVDAAISRFGVMFFEKPVDAFAAIKTNLRTEGRIIFSCWQSLRENEWASAPGQIAKEFVTEPLPAPDPLAPGPFAFADKDRIVSILTDAGWRGVDVHDWSGVINLPGKTLDDSTEFILKLGPIARLLKEQDVPLEPVGEALKDLLAKKLNDQGAPSLNGKAWIVSATAS